MYGNTVCEVKKQSVCEVLMSIGRKEKKKKKSSSNIFYGGFYSFIWRLYFCAVKKRELNNLSAPMEKSFATIFHFRNPNDILGTKFGYIYQKKK